MRFHMSLSTHLIKKEVKYWSCFNWSTDSDQSMKYIRLLIALDKFVFSYDQEIIVIYLIYFIIGIGFNNSCAK